MIVFSLTLFLFSSFTFFYKIRISKKPRTPRSTSWWVCLFKQCQCSLSFSVHRVVVLVWGGCVRCPLWCGFSCVQQGQSWCQALCQSASAGGGTPMSPLPLPCLLTCRGIFPGSPLPRCFHLPSGWQGAWAAPRSIPAGSRAIQAPLETMPRCSAFPRESWSHWGCRGGRLSSPGRCHLRGSGFGLSAWWQVPSAIPVCSWTWALPGRSTAATNYFWCCGGFSPLTVKLSEGENTGNHWTPKQNSSMSPLSTCQIINPLVQCTQIQFATLSSFGITYKLFTSNCAEIRWLYSPW